MVPDSVPYTKVVYILSGKKPATSTAQQAYIGNVNSKKFHLPSCANLPAEKNQILFSSYEEAIAAGYSPCSSCIK